MRHCVLFEFLVLMDMLFRVMGMLFCFMSVPLRVFF
jgi:hypothetical protein